MEHNVKKKTVNAINYLMSVFASPYWEILQWKQTLLLTMHVRNLITYYAPESTVDEPSAELFKNVTRRDKYFDEDARRQYYVLVR